MRSAHRLTLPAAVLIASVGVLSGCRPGTALHRRYNNFRAYYNTYYNASRKLDEGEQALLNVNTPVDRTRLVEVFPSGAATAGRTPIFDAAIDKSAELLRQRPDSKWADDALLVIGKAYFYERNFVGAEQKFRETITAAEITQDRRLADEARFWLGRTMAGADRYDEGVLVLRQALEQPGGDRYWTARMHLALGELYARAGRWDAATVDLRDGIEGIRDTDLAARSLLLLGQVEESGGRYDAAAEAYQAALARRPAYEVAFAAEINRGLVLGLDAARPDDGLATLRAMGRDDKHYDRRADVALAQARVLAASGQTDEARTRFRDVLYDEALAGQRIRGEAHFRFAEFYRDALGDYVTAAAHFDTAATAITPPPTTGQRASRAAIVGASGVATTYEAVARTSGRIGVIDSLLALGTMSESDFEARVAEIESVRRAEWIQQRREADALRTAQDFAGQGSIQTPFGSATGRSAGRTNDTGVETPGLGGNASAAAASTVANGFLGFRDPRTIQSGLLSFQRIYGDRPRVPNWRRRAAIQGGQLASSNGIGDSQPNAIPDANGLGGPPPLDLSGVPRTPGAQAILVTERASLRYELANTFFLALARPDRARILYQQILDETPDAPVASRARYALAELESESGEVDAAASLYRDVASVDSLGALGGAARARLDGREPVVVEETIDRRADDAYAEARSLWDAGDPLAAARALVLLADAAPDEPEAPRAYFAAALAYTDWARADSVILRAPLPPDLVPVTFGSPAAQRLDVPPSSAPDTTEAPDASGFGAAPASTRGSRRDRSALPRPARAAPLAGAPAPVGAPPPVGAEAPADSAVADTAGRARLGVPAAPSDSVRTAPDSLSAGAPSPPEAGLDSLGSGPLPVALEAPVAPGMTLRGYLTALAARYPGTPYAQRATTMVESLSRVEEAVPEALVSGIRGPEPVLPQRGGFSWAFGPFNALGEAQVRQVSFGDPSFRSVVVTDGTSFTVLLGQFETQEEAVNAAEAERRTLVQGATLTAVRGLTLADALDAVQAPGVSVEDGTPPQEPPTRPDAGRVDTGGADDS